jgi:hypothetical protein
MSENKLKQQIEAIEHRLNATEKVLELLIRHINPESFHAESIADALSKEQNKITGDLDNPVLESLQFYVSVFSDIADNDTLYSNDA